MVLALVTHGLSISQHFFCHSGFFFFGTVPIISLATGPGNHQTINLNNTNEEQCRQENASQTVSFVGYYLVLGHHVVRMYIIPCRR